MINVLLIHGSGEEQRTLASALAPEDFELIDAPDMASGLQKLYETYPDLIIVTEDLVAGSNEELWLRLRSVARLPIIVLGRGGDNTIRMLELGADTYLLTPVSAAVLKAWIRSLVRRYRRHRLNRYELLHLGSLDLSAAERRILGCLVLNEGRLVPYWQLASAIWGNESSSTDNLHYYVRRLKRKVNHGVISQERGFGYRFDRPGNGDPPQDGDGSGSHSE